MRTDYGSRHFEKAARGALPTAGRDFVIVDVPTLKFLMIDGERNPEGEPFSRSLQWLFAVVYPIKRVAKERIGKHFVEPPLEGLWWADDIADFVAGKKDRLKWRMMIPAIPDWVTADLFANAVAQAAERLGEAPRACGSTPTQRGEVSKSCISAPQQSNPRR